MAMEVPVSPSKKPQSKQCRESNTNIQDHFIAGLCRVDKYLHRQLWDIILHKSTISLNLFSQSRPLPHISAYTRIFGELDFNRTPLSPPGSRVVMNNRPNIVHCGLHMGKMDGT